ncbi:HU family DNA-binding protein [Desulfurobacterium sp.]
MVKEELIKEVTERVRKRTRERVKKEVIAAAVDETFSVIVEKVLAGNKVRIRNFGTFQLKKAGARLARNPKTGDEVQIPPREKFYFTPSRKIRFLEER